MYQKHKNADEPLICEVAEDNQESWQSMVKGVFEIISFRANEHVVKESTEVFSELNNIKHFHF